VREEGRTWRTYTNVRFAYAICYPQDWLKPQPEAPNSDGRRFEGASGASLAVWGSYAMDRTPASELAGDVRDIARDQGQVTYKVVKPGWAVYSAKVGDRIVYHRTTLSRGVLRGFEITYPASQAARWNPIVARISGCFRGVAGGV
jgi:hypothetical protein